MTPMKISPPSMWLMANLAFAAVSIAANSAMADPRSLRAVGNGPDVMITDCVDCGDDTGMTIECKGRGTFAQIEVPWAAMKQGVEGAAAPVTLQIAGKSYTYPAKTLHYDAIGYLPAFTIKPGDPLLAAMQSGNQAGVRFGDASTSISLANAGPAIETFVTNCWRPTGGQVAAAQPQQQAAPASRPLWCASQDNFNRTEMTICANSGLWQFDNQMAQTYQDAVNEFEAVHRKFGVQGQTAKLKSEQNNWLKVVRNGCQDDVACLEAAYRQRIEDVTPRGD